MPDIAVKTVSASGAAVDVSTRLHHRLMNCYFLLQGLTTLATTYYFNYLFFYMGRHFGFGNRANLLLTTLHGFTYTFSAWSAGTLGPKLGYLRLLRISFSGMLLAMVLGGLTPIIFGYSRTAMFAEVPILFLWSLSVCLTWPTIQALLSRHTPAPQLPHVAGIYNLLWAGCSAFSFLTGGALLDRFGGETIFWLPVGFFILELGLLVPITRWQNLSTALETSKLGTESIPEIVRAPAPEHLARSKAFLRLAWIANPFAYVAIYGLLPVIPKLTEHFGLTATYAGFVCSVFFWARLVAFVWFWLWPVWHYHFGWLLAAFLALIGSFIAILLSSHVWMLIASQVVFGLAIGLIYYSSLYYSMDAGTSRGKGGGLHEAAIGLGIFLGPAAGAVGLYFFPTNPNAGTWNITALLIIGLILFLSVKFRRQEKPA
jgi:MFS family permease